MEGTPTAEDSALLQSELAAAACRHYSCSNLADLGHGTAAQVLEEVQKEQRSAGLSNKRTLIGMPAGAAREGQQQWYLQAMLAGCSLAQSLEGSAGLQVGPASPVICALGGQVRGLAVC